MWYRYRYYTHINQYIAFVSRKTNKMEFCCTCNCITYHLFDAFHLHSFTSIKVNCRFFLFKDDAYNSIIYQNDASSMLMVKTYGQRCVQPVDLQNEEKKKGFFSSGFQFNANIWYQFKTMKLFFVVGIFRKWIQKSKKCIWPSQNWRRKTAQLNLLFNEIN